MKIFQLTEILTKLGFFATFLINLFFINLTLFYTQNITVTYKKMLIIFATTCIIFSFLEVIAQPFTYNFNGGIIYFSLHQTDILSPGALRVTLIIYAACYVTQTAFIAVQFLFRYVTVIQHKMMQKSFQGKTQIFWLLYLMLIWVMYGSALTMCFPLESFSDDYMKGEIRNVFSRDINDTPRVIAVAYQNGKVRWSTITYSTIAFAIIGLQYIIITFCTVKMRNALQTELQNMSSRNRTLERQFFKALTIQISLPTLLITLPLGLILLLPLLDIEVKCQTGLMFALYSLYPPLDSIATMVIVKEYKICVKKFLRDSKLVRLGPIAPMTPTNAMSITDIIL